MKLKYLTEKEEKMIRSRLFSLKIENIKSIKTVCGITRFSIGSDVWAIERDLFKRLLKEIENVTNNGEQ
jgi:hypothetical protein